MQNELKTLILQKSEAIFEELRTIRRHLHQYPELSFEEYQTCAFIQDTLKKWGISAIKTIATTGTLVTLEGKNPSKRTIALRADIDALPIQEQNNCSYRSRNAGSMHACGHDAHTTCLLGALKILHDTRDKWEGTIKGIFQPGEEKNPGGASWVIRDGALKNPDVDAIIGLHVHTDLPVGQYSFRAGCVMASADELHITIKGKGGHAAAPHRSIDTIFVATQFINALHHIISRYNDPFNPSVLSICSIQGGHTTNVIPETVQLKGTLRAMNESWRTHAHQLIKNIGHHIGAAFGASIDLNIDKGYPCVINDAALNEQARLYANALTGTEHCSETELRMGSEDFGYYSQLIPGCFYRLGVRPQHKEQIPGVHTPSFDIDESALLYGCRMQAWLGSQIAMKNI